MQTRSPLRTLIVEDSDDDAKLLVRDLRRAGCETEAYRVDTREAFSAALARGGWDLILSDFSMPGFSGQEALELVRAAGLDVPFIIVSGSLGEELAVQMMKAGAHDFFAKGKLTRLAAAIDREVGEAAQRRERVIEREKAEKERAGLLAELTAAVEARDRFLLIASHELRTPLTTLQLLVQGVRRQRPAETTSEARLAMMESKFETISRQTDRLTILIDGLLDVAHISSGTVTLSRESVDLRALVEGVLDESSGHITQSGSRIAFQADETVVGSWDRQRISTVVKGLLSNALKFGRGQPVEIRISAASGVACLTVTDNGFGIPLEDQSRIFAKFERAVPLQHYGGFGLGLWIARQIVDAHQGTIEVTSEGGRGSTFRVNLPL
jgi:signal transduction histidine kinase